jgi:hypothetical protein
MAGETIAVALGFEDETSGAANSAASSLMRLKATIDEDSSALKEMQAQMRILKSATTPNAQAIDDLKARMTAAKASIADATAAIVNMGGSSKALARIQSEQASASKDAAAVLARQASVLTPLQAAELQVEAAARKAAAAIAAMSAAAKANSTTFNYAANSQKKYADSIKESVTQNIANIKTTLPSTSALDKAREAMLGAAKGTKGFSDEQKQALDAVKGMAGPLGGVFERLQLLRNAMGATSNGEMAMAGGAVVATVAVLTLLSAAGSLYLKLASLAVTLNKNAMEKLQKASAKAQEGFSRLFSGVHVDKLVTAVEDLVSLLDEGSASAEGLKSVISVMLNPLFDMASTVGPVVKNVFRGMVLAVLFATVAILKFRNVLQDLIPQPIVSAIADLTANINMVYVGVGIGIAVVAALAVVLVALSIAFTVVAAAIFIATLPLNIVIALLLILAAVLLAPVVAIILLVAYFDEAKAALMSLASTGATAASGLISGLVDGIISGGASAIAAIVGLGGSMKNALMNALGIHSPSTVFAELGGYIAEGTAQGVEGGAPGVNQAVGEMVEVPETGGGGGRASGARGASITIPVTFVGSSQAEQGMIRGFLDQVCGAFEEGLSSAGIPVKVEVT